MLHLISSNRYETLRARLLTHLLQGPQDPLQTQEIIIPSAALKRDIQLAAAQTSLVVAGLEFSFLAQWLWQRIAQLVPVAPISPFAPERSTWHLLRLLHEQELTTPFPRLQRYLEQADPVMTLQLAERLAGLFERYITYRPDWLALWSQGEPAGLHGHRPETREDEAWQRALWQRFTSELGTASQHPSSLFFDALKTLGPEGARQAGLPREAHIFCLSSLPPLYLKILQQLAHWIEVRLYLLNPCEDYWYELVAPKYQARLELQGQAEYLDDRHPLLAHWGSQTQAMLGLIHETIHSTGTEASSFIPAPGDTLLALFQNSLLFLENPSPATWPLAEQDRSIEIHVAHSLSRELEILQDQLLARLEADPSLEPADILVALPDLETALPFIDAVFGNSGKIPYTITGQKAVHSNPVARFLLQLLDLAAPSGRLPATEVFAFLQEPLPARTLSLEPETLTHLQTALHKAGVRWGLDAERRQAAGLPPDPRHTWRDALARLLLGYALPDSGTDAAAQTVFADIIGSDSLKGSRAPILGALWRFLNQMEQLGQKLAQPHQAAGWLEIWHTQLGLWCEPYLHTPEELENLQAVYGALTSLGAALQEGCQSLPLAFPVARRALEQALETQTRGGTPSGSLTFSPLSSLRHLPYRHICLIGLNDGTFPSQHPPLEFDLLPLENRPGDRQQQQEDRALFLDLILAAREGLYLSYTGRSQKDDSPQPPSTLIAELLEFLCRATGAPPVRFVVQHPLQAFSPEYFTTKKTDPRLVSYQTEFASVLTQKANAPLHTPTPVSHVDHAPNTPDSGEEEHEAGTQEASPTPPFFCSPIPPVPCTSISLKQLQDFFRHPARFLLRDHLGLNLQPHDTELEDEEPLMLDSLGRYVLENRLLTSALSQTPPGKPAATSQLTRLALAGPELPGGQIGEAILAELLPELRQFIEHLNSYRPHLSPQPLSFRLEIPPLSLPLYGQLAQWGPKGLLRYRCARAKATDYLAAWLDHLCLNALKPEGVCLQTHHIARDQHFIFTPVDQPLELLAELLTLYQEGLCWPLAFYPETAWAFHTAGASTAQTTWLGNERQAGESQDPWWQQALQGQPHTGTDLTGEAFQTCSARILGPLLKHLTTPENDRTTASAP